MAFFRGGEIKLVGKREKLEEINYDVSYCYYSTRLVFKNLVARVR